MRIFYIALLLPQLCFAFRLDPMVVNIPVPGLQGSGTYTVENNTKEKVALQFEIRERVIDREGKESRPETKGFLIYPEQVSLEPGEKRSVRVSWMGEAKLDQEGSFRFIASQLPVDFKNTASNETRNVKLKFLIEYVASLYLVPPKAKAKMKVLSSTVNKKTLEVLLRNEGTAHQLLDRLNISLKNGGKTISLSAKTLENARTENILPRSERLLKIPLPEQFSSPTVDIDFGN